LKAKKNGVVVRASDEYECARCGGTFEKALSEEEARAELKEFFGDVSVGECVLVCDDCWQKIRPVKGGENEREDRVSN